MLENKGCMILIKKIIIILFVFINYLIQIWKFILYQWTSYVSNYDHPAHACAISYFIRVCLSVRDAQ